MSRRLMSQMNVVPYIDVMLVLLIIFMVTSHLARPQTPEKVREEVKRSQQELMEQKMVLAKLQNELNAMAMAKEREIYRLEKLRTDVQTEQLRLAETKNQQEKQTRQLNSSRQKMEEQVAEARSRLDEVKRLQQEEQSRLVELQDEIRELEQNRTTSEEWEFTQYNHRAVAKNQDGDLVEAEISNEEKSILNLTRKGNQITGSFSAYTFISGQRVGGNRCSSKIEGEIDGDQIEFIEYMTDDACCDGARTKYSGTIQNDRIKVDYYPLGETPFGCIQYFGRGVGTKR